jgi:hypothetical protein|tara:strand:+ start:534 stop:1895 length:1362 start_codon:yes stop_codon:yes gene_type:complete
MARNNFIENDSGTSLTPGSYNLKKVELTTHSGERLEIQNIVLNLNLTESIYTPNIVAKISVKDVNNLFESAPLIGQEEIHIILERKIWSTWRRKYITKDIDLKFTVTEYPLYGRPQEEHTQLYTIACVSVHAYDSQLKKISRAVDDVTSEEIERIITKDLKYKKFEIEGKPISRMKGIINWQTPLDAAEWLRKQTYDKNMSPFLLFQTIDGTVNLSSLVELLKSDTYHTYYDTREFQFGAYTEDDYNERASRILDIASNVKFGKIYQGVNGAWASENNYLDYAYKTYTKYDYNYEDDFKYKNTLNKKKAFSNDTGWFEKSINEMPQSHLEHVSINNLSYGEKDINYNKLKENTNGITRAIDELLETASHDIKLHGDYELNPGTVIELKFPRAIDPIDMKKYLAKMKNKPKADRDLWDEHLSGRHLITSVNHTFSGGEYFSEVRVKRDSFSIKL